MRERKDLQGPPIVPFARPERPESPDHTRFTRDAFRYSTLLTLPPPLGNPHVHIETLNDTLNKGPALIQKKKKKQGARGPVSPVIKENVPGVLKLATDRKSVV